VKNLLSPAVNRGDLLRLNYNKTIFDRGSALDPAGRAHSALLDPRVDAEGYFLPILLLFRLGTQGRLVLLLNWYPHFLDQSYAPGTTLRWFTSFVTSNSCKNCVVVTHCRLQSASPTVCKISPTHYTWLYGTYSRTVDSRIVTRAVGVYCFLLLSPIIDGPRYIQTFCSAWPHITHPGIWGWRVRSNSRTRPVATQEASVVTWTGRQEGRNKGNWSIGRLGSWRHWRRSVVQVPTDCCAVISNMCASASIHDRTRVQDGLTLSVSFSLTRTRSRELDQTERNYYQK